MSSSLWWFDGLTPPNYATEVTLSTYPGWPTGTVFTWIITERSDKALFANGSDTYTVVDDITAPLVSIAASPPAASMTYDVSISLYINGQYIAWIVLGVLTPRSLQHKRDVDRANGGGYASYIVYRILNQFGDTLPYRVGVNEKFTSDPEPDEQFEDWRRGDAFGLEVNPEGWSDLITSPATDDVTWPTPLNPGESSPGGLPGDDPVDHWNGEWRVGSTSVGTGVLVQRNTWQRYQDHARHTNVVSPVS
jgi:hypothetical protein